MTGSTQQAAGRGQHGDEDGGRQAMDEAQPGQADRHPVDRLHFLLTFANMDSPFS